MFGIGGFELFIILLFGFLIFGPDKLPDMARTLGRAIARFREVQQDMTDAIGGDKLVDLDNPDAPFKNPVDVLDKVIEKQTKRSATASTGGSSKDGQSQDAKEGQGQEGSKAVVSVNESADSEGSKTQNSDATFPKAETFTQRKARYEKERAALAAKEADSNSEISEEASGAAASAESKSDEGGEQ